MKSRRARPVPFLLLAFLLGPAAAQEATQPATPTQDPTAGAAARAQGNGARRGVQDPVRRAALLTLAEEVDALGTELQQARSALPQATDRPAELARIADLEQRVREAEWRLNSLVVGLDVKAFDAPQTQDYDLQRELTRLLQPLVQKVSDLTSEPRELEEMDNRIEEIEKTLLRTAREARVRTDREFEALTGDDADTERLRAQLARIRQGWDARIRSLGQRLTVLKAEYANRTESRTSLVDTIMESTQSFFQERGLHLLMAALAFLAAFLGVRFVQRRVGSAGKQRAERTFSLRLVDVLLQVLAVFAGVGAILVVLYVVNDFLLLTIALVFLLGAGWAAMKMLPQFFEQLRLMLNLGAVREGERVVIDGLPWRVDALKFYSVLSNPALQGGLLRVPIRDLVAWRSRPMHRDEPWFPTRVGDWVLLADGTRGRVLVQSPESVVLAHLGGEKSYQTSSFLGEQPRNMSKGYVLDVIFGVDYEHQRDATSAIPAAFRAALQKDLPGTVEARFIKKIDAEFRQAGASSLDVLVLVEMDGETAKESLVIQRAINRILVDTCTLRGWGIPFTQITVHQAKA